MTTQTMTRPVFDLGLARLAHNIARIFASMAASQRAIREFERLNNQTDAQLSAQGMGRADVARVVFEKHFH
jgi:hypothetical protein